MAYDQYGNYVKSAGELVHYLDSGAEFRDPTMINTDSILNMEPIYPVSNANLKSNNTINSIATAFEGVGANLGSLMTVAVWGFTAAIAIKLFKKL